MALINNCRFFACRAFCLPQLSFRKFTVHSALNSGFKGRQKINSRQSAHDFIFRLSHKERSILLDELKHFQSQATAIQPEDVSKTAPTSLQLRAVAAHSAMPFIGFGFLDNFIMIIAGDYIDTTLGLTLGISTMAAAGLGNTLSDVAGIGSAYYVELIAAKFGVNVPALTPAQLTMSSTRWTSNLGRAVGVIIGCVLGMFPLLFILPKESTKTNTNESPQTK